MEGRLWEQKSKDSLKKLIEKRIRSIIGVSLQSVEDNMDDKVGYNQIRYSIMKVCNDIARKLTEDLDSFTVKKNSFEYKMPFRGEQ